MLQALRVAFGRIVASFTEHIHKYSKYDVAYNTKSKQQLFEHDPKAERVAAAAAASQKKQPRT